MVEGDCLIWLCKNAWWFIVCESSRISSFGYCMKYCVPMLIWNKPTYIAKWIIVPTHPLFTTNGVLLVSKPVLHGKYIRIMCVGVCLCWIPRTNGSHILKDTVTLLRPLCFLAFWCFGCQQNLSQHFTRFLTLVFWNLNIWQAGSL